MAIIFHITKRADWLTAQEAGQYEPKSLRTQGYIHCSSRHQALRIADGLFRGQSDLVLLHIDEDHVAAEVRYENCEGGEEPFPHVYGVLNLDAVTYVFEFTPRADGTFDWPEQK